MSNPLDLDALDRAWEIETKLVQQVLEDGAAAFCVNRCFTEAQPGRHHIRCNALTKAYKEWFPHLIAAAVRDREELQEKLNHERRLQAEVNEGRACAYAKEHHACQCCQFVEQVGAENEALRLEVERLKAENDAYAGVVDGSVPQVNGLIAERDKLAAEVARLHKLVCAARNYIDPEKHPEWERAAYQEAEDCEAHAERLTAQVAALTQERDALRSEQADLHELLARARAIINPEAHPEWDATTSEKLGTCDQLFEEINRVKAENDALREALRAIADAALLDQWSAIELLGHALGVPVSQLGSREAFGKVARTALGQMSKGDSK